MGRGSTQPAAWNSGVSAACTSARVATTGTTVTGVAGKSQSRSDQPSSAAKPSEQCRGNHVAA